MALLRPLDILVVAKIASSPSFGRNVFHRLAGSLLISKSSAHDAVQRAQASGLLYEDRTIVPRAVAELFAFGVRYLVPAALGPETRGVPTSHGFLPLSIAFGERSDAPVWPSADGPVRGPSVVPLYKTVPEAVKQDSALHQTLAAIDGIRIGRAREIGLAKAWFKERFEVSEW